MLSTGKLAETPEVVTIVSFIVMNLEKVSSGIIFFMIGLLWYFDIEPTNQLRNPCGMKQMTLHASQRIT